MSKKNTWKVAALAASIALAMGAAPAMAATAPAATQLPGKGAFTGNVSAGDIVTNLDGSVNQTINVTGAAVIDWGKGSQINADGTGGFNIGSAASLTFVGNSAPGISDGVLNVDSSGNVSQIFGVLQGQSVNGNAMNIFVADANGVIVGAGAEISSTVSSQIGLVGHAALDTPAFDGNDGSLAFNGAGGDVVVQKGASIGAGSPLAAVLVAGGNTVNVDLSAFRSGAVTLNAGGYDYNQNGGPASTYNDAASMSIAGSFDGARIDRVVSGGDVANGGTLDFSGRGDAGTLSVAGTFTNTGSLTLIDGMTLDGALVNKKTVNTGGVTLGGLSNDGEFSADGAVTIAGDMTNQGKFSAVGVTVAKGGLANVGTLAANGAISVSGGNLANSGQITDASEIGVTGGDLTNQGDIQVDGGQVTATDGSIVNHGMLTGAGSIVTASDEGLTAGADYSITNTGTLRFSGEVLVNGHSDSADNDTTGSFSNTGTLQVAGMPRPLMLVADFSEQLLPAAAALNVYAHDDINLGGALEVENSSGKFAAVTPDNPLSVVMLQAGKGTLTVSTPIAFTGFDEFDFSPSASAEFAGQKVKLMADVTGADDSTLIVGAGDKLADDYAIRIGSGVTVSAGMVGLGGVTADEHPNVILQGTLAGNAIYLGGEYSAIGGVGFQAENVSRLYSVSDVFSGSNGGLVATGKGPSVEMHFTGRVKSAPYLNAGNFRYNGLPITVADGTGVQLTLDPIAYQTNGTPNGLSAVNVLVNGNVDLSGAWIDSPVAVDGTAVTGVANWQNTHLVLQSTGNIATTGEFYWPGYVYLGTIDTSADGAAAPGTLGLGAISLNGDFSNVLPGSVDGGAGIHLISQLPLQGSGHVLTNAGSWINFASDTLTQGYANGVLGGGKVSFYGGANSAGNVVNYGELDASRFHTHAPDATR